MGHLLATSMMAASVTLTHALRVRGGGGGGDGRALVLLVPSGAGRSGAGLGLRLRLGSGHVKREEKRDGTTTRTVGRDARLHMRCVGGLEAHTFMPRTRH